MSNISLLPEEMRGKEELKSGGSQPTSEQAPAGLRMHVPDTEPEEDIEIIEVDEGDLASVLADEPMMTRLTYKLSSAIDKIRNQLFEKKDHVPPAKVPPQFFKPPKPGLVTRPQVPPSGQVQIRPLGMPQGPMPLKTGVPARRIETGVATGNGERPRARIMPQAEVPRRVRVIRRVRKPVRVSLISSKELAALTVDVSKRQWTVSAISIIFIAVLVSSILFLNGQVAAAKGRRAAIQAELAATRAETDSRLKTWSAYESLQSRLEILDGALKHHIIVTRLFDFLETRTLPTVTYRNASWSAQGQLSLDVTTDSFESAASQLVAFKESEGVKSVESTSFGLTGGGEKEVSTVGFQIILSLDPLIFQNPALTPVSAGVTSTERGSP
jgi:hypothetical protein